MPEIRFHKHGTCHSATVADDTNLVVRAAIRQFPFPHLSFGCGMGKCGKCACRVLDGADNLPPPNWKETKRLGERIDQGYRLLCQIWLRHDIALAQDEAV